jgi:hypothetical protein
MARDDELQDFKRRIDLREYAADLGYALRDRHAIYGRRTGPVDSRTPNAQPPNEITREGKRPRVNTRGPAVHPD